MDPRTGLYSKAAQIIRKLPQQRASANEFIAMAKNKFGLKEAELKNAGSLPEGPIDRKLLAQIFEARQPNIQVSQYGKNPSYLPPEQVRSFHDLTWRRNDPTQKNPLSPEEDDVRKNLYKMLTDRHLAAPNVVQREDDDGKLVPEETQYSGYTSEGTKNYRERLLTLPSRHVSDEALGYPENHPMVKAQQNADTAMRMLQRDAREYGYDHPITQQSRENFNRHSEELSRLKTLLGESPRVKEDYYSSHWGDHHNVLAHIRMSDRMVGEDRESVQPIAERVANHFKAGVGELGSYAADQAVNDGVISPEEAASLSRLMGFRLSKHFSLPGIGKRLLHVEELQSDWAQEGRDIGFNDGSAMKAYEDHVKDMRDRMRQSLLDQGLPENVASPLYENVEPWHLAKFHGEEDKLNSLRDAVNDQRGKLPAAPYVQNTQHWTDLALKNVLREAALGNYDGVVFPAGQNQADRYGLEKHLDTLTYHPKSQRLTGYRGEDDVFQKDAVEPKDLAAHVGKEVADRLLDPQNARNAGTDDQIHVLQGDGLKAGGQGMRGYYDGIVPKSAMNLARQHDPEIKPAEPVSYSEGKSEYSGFHLPMTDKLRQGILNEGFPAMRRGGRVDAALNLTRRFTKDGKGATMDLGVKE